MEEIAENFAKAHLDSSVVCLNRAWDMAAAAKVNYEQAGNNYAASNCDRMMSDIAQIIWEMKIQIEPDTRAMEGE